jgi:YVTN family beta-propeller protein
MVITPDGRTIYVLEAPYGVAVVNVASNTAAGFIKIRDAEGFVITPDGKTLYVSNTGGSMVTPVDTRTNSVLRAVRTGLTGSGPGRITMAPDGKTLYVLGERGPLNSRRSTAIVPIRTSTNKALPPIVSTSYSPMTISPDSKMAYQAADDGVLPVNLIAHTVGKVIKLSGVPYLGYYSLAISPDSRTLYVLVPPAGDKTNEVLRINTATDARETPVKLRTPASWMADGMVPGPGGRTLYVFFNPGGNPQTGSILPVNPATGRVAKPIRIPDFPVYAVFHG